MASRRGTIYNYGFPIMAGLYERFRLGRGMADLPASLKLAALLLCLDDHGWNLTSEKEALRAALEAEGDHDATGARGVRAPVDRTGAQGG